VDLIGHCNDQHGRARAFQQAILLAKFFIEDGSLRLNKGRRVGRGRRTLAIVSLGALMLRRKLGLELLEQLAEASERRVASVLGAPHGHGDG
jgi:hypothetical protein